MSGVYTQTVKIKRSATVCKNYNLPAVRREFPAKGGKRNWYPFSNIPTKCQYSLENLSSVDPPHMIFSPLYKKVHVQMNEMQIIATSRANWKTSCRIWLRHHLSSAAAHDSITNHHSSTSTIEIKIDAFWVRIFRSSSRMTHLRTKICDLRCLHHWIQAHQVENFYMLPCSARLVSRHYVTTTTYVVIHATLNRKTVCSQLKIQLGTWQYR